MHLSQRGEAGLPTQRRGPPTVRVSSSHVALDAYAIKRTAAGCISQQPPPGVWNLPPKVPARSFDYPQLWLNSATEDALGFRKQMRAFDSQAWR